MDLLGGVGNSIDGPFGDLGGNDSGSCLSGSDNPYGTNRSGEDSVFTIEEDWRCDLVFG